jgi:hypothetical protein
VDAVVARALVNPTQIQRVLDAAVDGSDAFHRDDVSEVQCRRQVNVSYPFTRSYRQPCRTSPKNDQWGILLLSAQASSERNNSYTGTINPTIRANRECTC